MITAESAKNISLNCKFTYIEKLITEAANKGQRSISLLNENISLTEDEIHELQNLGYKIHNGHSGKCGPFDIISW